MYCITCSAPSCEPFALCSAPHTPPPQQVPPPAPQHCIPLNDKYSPHNHTPDKICSHGAKDPVAMLCRHELWRATMVSPLGVPRCTHDKLQRLPRLLLNSWYPCTAASAATATTAAFPPCFILPPSPPQAAAAVHAVTDVCVLKMYCCCYYCCRRLTFWLKLSRFSCASFSFSARFSSRTFSACRRAACRHARRCVSVHDCVLMVH